MFCDATRSRNGSGRERKSWCSSTRIRVVIMSRSDAKSDSPTRPSGSGENAGVRAISLWKTSREPEGPRRFPPADVAEIKAAACQMVRETEQPLSKQSTLDLARRMSGPIGKPISKSSVWRILNGAVIKPWQHRSWIFPRAEDFAEKAAVILDLYAGVWDGQPLGPNDYVLSSDEKTSIQARIRCHPGLPVQAGQPQRVESEYARGGALQYLAAWDVHRAKVFGRCEPSTGIDPFSRLVDDVMHTPPYASADRVFWIVDNGSSHRGQSSCDRLSTAYPNAILIHTPVHASWLNQIEIYFSIVQRKVLLPNDFRSLSEVEDRLLAFQDYYMEHAEPFSWKFDRQMLNAFTRRLENARFGKLRAECSRLQPYLHL